MSFGGDLRKFQAKTEAKMGRVVRKISLDMFTEVIMMSPVDTGRFRGNWQTAVGDAPDGTVELLDPDGNTVIAKASGAVAEMKPGDVIYMANNLPYAEALEDGWSGQAPGGMVALTLQKYVPIADRIIRQIGAE